MAKDSKLTSKSNYNDHKKDVINIPNKSSEIYFKTIFENAGIGIALFDTTRKIITSNLAFRKLVKYSEDELSILTQKDLIYPDDEKIAEKLFEEIAKGKRKECSIEIRYLAKDESIVHSKTSISSTLDVKNKTKSILIIIEDISRQKQFESKLLSEKNFLDALLENSPDQIYFKDLNSRFLKSSTALAKKHNKHVEDLIGKTDFDVFGVLHAGEAYKDEQEIIKTGIPIIGKEEREDWADGRMAWVSTSKMPFYDEEGKLIGTFGISRDITLKKRNEQSQEAIFKISETAFTAPDMLSMFKRIHDVIEMLMPAKNICIVLYNEKDDILTFPYFIDRLNKPREKTKPQKEMAEYVLRTGKATLLDSTRLKKLTESGEIELLGTPPKIWLGVPLKFTGRIVGVIAVFDYEDPTCYGESEMQLVTFIAEQIAQVIERKKNADEIQKYADELAQLNATKDRFFSILAHDLKNPFITIMGFSELLCSDYNELSDEERLFYIQEMKKSADSSYNLLENLLHWSRSQTGKIKFRPKKIELREIIENNFLLLETTANNKDILMKNEIEQDTYVNADEEMINTVFRNLLTNAIKFSRKGGTISVSSNINSEFSEICISDQGVGMDEATISNIFRLDISLSTPGTENEKGTGLGLILCKEFIEKNGGKIWVESKVGEGSKFFFTLPLSI